TGRYARIRDHLGKLHLRPVAAQVPPKSLLFCRRPVPRIEHGFLFAPHVCPHERAGQTGQSRRRRTPARNDSALPERRRGMRVAPAVPRAEVSRAAARSRGERVSRLGSSASAASRACARRACSSRRVSFCPLAASFLGVYGSEGRRTARVGASFFGASNDVFASGFGRYMISVLPR